MFLRRNSDEPFEYNECPPVFGKKIFTVPGQQQMLCFPIEFFHTFLFKGETIPFLY